MEKFHYVYRITNLNPVDERKYYIGVRSSKVKPEEDTNYKSSSKYLKKAIKEIGHSNFVKEILTEWSSRELATKEEIRLHNNFDVAKNPEYYNMSKQTSTGFDPTGFINVIDTSDNTKKYVSIREYYENDNYISWKKDMITVLNLETGNYKNVKRGVFEGDDNLVGPNKNKVTVMDKTTGKTIQVSKDDFENNDRYVSINKNKVVVVDKRNNKRRSVTLDEYNSHDYYESISKNKVNVIDENNQYKRILKSDVDGKKYKQTKRILVMDSSGTYKKVSPEEYKSCDDYETPSANRVLVIIDGKTKYVSKEEYESGNYNHINSGKMPVEDLRDNKKKMISVDEYNMNKEYYTHVCCKRYEIYDKDDKLQHIITVGLENYCRQHSLPFRVLENSYLKNGEPIYKNPNKTIRANGNIKYKGWYAIKVD